MTKQRYFLSLSYRGTRYSGWQIQPNDPSVQETLETAISTILRETVGITGCGRTDAGVHARYYVAHFDTEAEVPDNLLNRLNSLLPEDIAVFDIQLMPPEAHARFDAYERSYSYHITFRKDPFLTETAWFYPQFQKLNIDKMDDIANMLPYYPAFFPFCKTNSGLEHYNCTLIRATWKRLPDEQGLMFHITANRFLRGMVRLIVGASIQTAIGQLTIPAIQEALEKQQPLPKSLSAPPQGLFLTDVKY